MRSWIVVSVCTAELVFSLVGCSRLVVVPGPGKTDQEFRQDRYECIKESSHRGWGFGAGGYSASGWGGERVNEDQFYACMEVRGHLTRRKNKITGSLSEP